MRKDIYIIENQDQYRSALDETDLWDNLFHGLHNPEDIISIMESGTMMGRRERIRYAAYHERSDNLLQRVSQLNEYGYAMSSIADKLRFFCGMPYQAPGQDWKEDVSTETHTGFGGLHLAMHVSAGTGHEPLVLSFRNPLRGEMPSDAVIFCNYLPLNDTEAGFCGVVSSRANMDMAEQAIGKYLEKNPGARVARLYINQIRHE